MPILPVNANGREIAAPEALRRACLAQGPGAPVTVMVHGFRFCPASPMDTPHSHILSLSPSRSCWKAISWPRHLHLDRPGRGLGIGFGWPARGPVGTVAARAFDAGAALAKAIGIIRATRPDLTVQIIAHSFGARVALAALEALGPDDLRQVILLSGAEYRSRAQAAIGGKTTRVLNVTSGENALFDAMFRLAVSAPHWRDRPLAAGLADHPRWIDLRIDAADHRAALAALGFATRPPATRICHWSGYLRPGLFSLYRALFDPTQAELFHQLAAALPERPAQASARAKPALWRGGGWPSNAARS